MGVRLASEWTRAWIVGCLALALGGWVGCSLLRPWGSTAIGSAGDGAPVAIGRAEWDELRAALARLETALRAPELALPDSRSSVGASALAPEALVELARDVRDLRAALERLRVLAERVATGSSAAPTPREILDAAPEVDWAAIDALRVLVEEDDEAAVRPLRLSTPSEIVRRFGEPTDVYRHGEGIGLQYAREVDLGGEFTERRGLHFTFIDGYLQALWIE